MNAHVDIASLRSRMADPIIALAAAEEAAWRKSNAARTDATHQRAWERWCVHADALFAATPTTTAGLVAMLEAYWNHAVTEHGHRELDLSEEYELRQLRAVIDAGQRLVAAQGRTQ